MDENKILFGNHIAGIYRVYSWNINGKSIYLVYTWYIPEQNFWGFQMTVSVGPPDPGCGVSQRGGTRACLLCVKGGGSPGIAKLASCPNLQRMGAGGAVAAHERHGDVLCSLLPGRDAPVREAEHTLAARCPEG